MYMAITGFFHQPKNKLEEAVQNLIKSYDRNLYKDSEIEEVKERIVKDVDALNDRFPRCTKVSASWWTPGAADDEEKDFIFGLTPNQCVSLQLFATKEIKE